MAILLDEDVTDTQIIEFHHGNGEVDEWSMRETVSRDIAISIAIYFHHTGFIPKGYRWIGNTTYLPLDPD